MLIDVIKLPSVPDAVELVVLPFDNLSDYRSNVAQTVVNWRNAINIVELFLRENYGQPFEYSEYYEYNNSQPTRVHEVTDQYLRVIDRSEHRWAYISRSNGTLKTYIFTDQIDIDSLIIELKLIT